MRARELASKASGRRQIDARVALDLGQLGVEARLAPSISTRTKPALVHELTRAASALFASSAAHRRRPARAEDRRDDQPLPGCCSIARLAMRPGRRVRAGRVRRAVRRSGAREQHAQVVVISVVVATVERDGGDVPASTDRGPSPSCARRRFVALPRNWRA